MISPSILMITRAYEAKMYHVIFLHACWSWESFLKKNKSILCLFLNFCRFCQTSKVNSTWCLIRSIIHRLKTWLVIFVCVISSILCKRRFHCISLKRLWLASVDIDTYCFDGSAINFWVQTELMQWATVCYRYCMSQTGTAVCVYSYVFVNVAEVDRSSQTNPQTD